MLVGSCFELQGARSGNGGGTPTADEHGRPAFARRLVAVATEGSVVVIELADRMYDMRPRKSVPESRRRCITGETPDVRALSAELPETADINWQLEDRAFKYLMPYEYKAVSRLINRKRVEREAYTRRCVALLKKALEDAGINGSVYGRTKHLYSIYQKLQRYHACGRKFRELHDLTGLRVIVDSVTDCYFSLGVVHQKWRPVAGRFDDYIASPKENRYQSLHTSVIGPEGHRLEVQIRTKEMHRVAEEGVAAHSWYKQTEPDRRRTRPQEKPAQLEQPFERQRENSADWEYLEA